MNLSYEPPTWQFLSNQLLEQQLAIVNQKMDKIFQQYSNLTLGNYFYYIINLYKTK